LVRASKDQYINGLPQIILIFLKGMDSLPHLAGINAIFIFCILVYLFELVQSQVFHLFYKLVHYNKHLNF